MCTIHNEQEKLKKSLSQDIGNQFEGFFKKVSSSF